MTTLFESYIVVGRFVSRRRYGPREQSSRQTMVLQWSALFGMYASRIGIRVESRGMERRHPLVIRVSRVGPTTKKYSPASSTNPDVHKLYYPPIQLRYQ